MRRAVSGTLALLAALQCADDRGDARDHGTGGGAGFGEARGGRDSALGGR